MNTPSGYVPAEAYLSVLRELIELRRLRDRTPRVWLAMDTVPEGVMVLAPSNYVIPANSRPYRAATAVVEMLEMPAFGELVAAEKARRAAAEETTEGGAAG
jgi:hypothetical protein